MKRLLSALTFCYSLNLHAQTLSAYDLIKGSRCQTFQCANDLIVSKGCDYDSYAKEPDFTTYTFFTDGYDYYGEGGVKTKGMVQYRKYNGSQMTSIGYTTANRNYYRGLFSQFEALNFIENKTTHYKNSIITFYSSKAYPKMTLQICVARAETAGQGYATYSFEFFSNSIW